MPGWLSTALFVAAFVISLFGYAIWKHRRQMRKLAAARPSPSRADFVTSLAASVDTEIAEWMWETLTPYYQPLTPDPEDDLIRDAWIDDDDISMDWLPAFAKAHGLSWKNWPDWPEGWDVTVRNYSRWLQLGLSASR